MRFLIVFTLLLLPIAVPAQWLRQKVDTTAGFRGLAVIDRTVVWASGTGGTVIRTVDGGVTWRVITVPGAGKLDFRDIEAFDANTAYILSIGNGDASRIWREAKDGADLHARLLDLPGFGPMKAETLLAILGKQLGVAPAGWEAFLPDHMTLGDVDGPDALRRYQDWKRGMKAEKRAALSS